MRAAREAAVGGAGRADSQSLKKPIKGDITAKKGIITGEV